MPSTTRRYLILSSMLLVLLAYGKFFSKPPGNPNILRNNEELLSYIDKFGVGASLDRLQEIEDEQNLAGECHVVAHGVGIYAFNKFGEEAFSLCTEKCGGGCYHGAIGAYAQKHGGENFVDVLRTACQDKDALDEFDSENQCVHGLGHGLMAWANYELFEALETCERAFSENSWKTMECWRGVFMENIVGTHMPREDYSKYLSDDPAYPCTIVDKKYKNSCYQFVVFRMGALYGNDFKKLAEGCANKVPSPYDKACFSTLGYNAARFYKNNAAEAKRVCDYASGNAKELCLLGARAI